MQKIIIANQSVGETTIDIANAFAGSGAHVELVAGIRSGDDLSRLDKSIKIRKICAYDKRNNVRRLFTWTLGAWQMLHIFKKERESRLLIFSNPPFATLMPIFCKNEFSLVIFDLYPDVLVSTRIVKENGFLVKKWREFNKKIFARARTVFTIGESLKKRISKSVESKKICVVPLWSTEANANGTKIAKEENHFLKEHNITNKFVITYSGNLGATHDREAIIELAEKFRGDDRVAFVVVTDGAGNDFIKKEISKKYLENIILIPPQQSDIFAQILAGTDLSLITLAEEASSISVPSKTFSALAAGCALLCIAGADSELAGICSRRNVGKNFTHKEIAHAAEFVNELISKPSRLELLRENARNAAKNFYSPRNAQRYVELA